MQETITNTFTPASVKPRVQKIATSTVGDKIPAREFSADYGVNESGFRYNADIRYSVEAKQWLREIEENELYDTGIDAEFGDEFLTLTTCNKAHRSDGRFVVVCRRLRAGEEIE